MISGDDALHGPEIHVWLSVLSERHKPTDISAVVGIDPDSSWMVGEIRPPLLAPATRHGWTVKSGLPKIGATLEAHIESLLGRVRGVAHNIRRLATEADVDVMCLVYTDQRLIIAWDAWVVRELSSLGVGLGIEVYRKVS